MIIDTATPHLAAAQQKILSKNVILISQLSSLTIDKTEAAGRCTILLLPALSSGNSTQVRESHIISGSTCFATIVALLVSDGAALLVLGTEVM
jgi:hypothetical protein